MNEVQSAAKDVAQLVVDHVGRKDREAFMAALHARLSTAQSYGADWSDVLNQVHVSLKNERIKEGGGEPWVHDLVEKAAKE